MPCALPPGAPRSGFLYKLFPAFGAGDGDGAFAPGDAHLLAAAGAVKIPVIPVPEPLEKHHKFPVFLVSPIGVPGKGAENCQKQQNIGQKQQNKLHAHPGHEGGQDAGDHTGDEYGQIQLIRPIAACHEALEALAQPLKESGGFHKIPSLINRFYIL